MAAYGIGAAAGGFADGFIKGRMLREQINSNKMEKQLNEERLKNAERKGKREDAIEEGRSRLSASLSQIESDRDAGTGGYSQFMPEQMGLSPPSEARTQPPAAAGITPPVAPQAPSNPTVKSPWRDPYSMYRDPSGANDFHYSQIADAYKKYFVDIGEPEKALAVDNTLSEMREKKVDKLVKGAAAAMFVGAPEALGLLDRVSSVAGFGRVDTKSGTFDPETKTWNGIKMIQADGTETVRSFTPADMMSLAYHGDPAKHFEMLNDKNYRDAALKNQERGLDNEDERLRIEGERVKVQEDHNAFEREDRAEDRRLKRERANVEILHQLISSSFKPPIEPDPSVFKAASYDDAAKAQVQQYNNAVVQYESRAELTQSMVGGAQNLMALNPGLKPQDAAYVVQNRDRLGKVTPDADGRYYLNFKGMRILLQ